MAVPIISIIVFEHNGERFVLDGHHRVEAAKRAGLDQIPYESVQLPSFVYQTADEVVEAAAYAGPVKLR